MKKETYINNWQVLTKKWSNGMLSTVATKGETVGEMFLMNWDAERIRSVSLKIRATKSSIDKMHNEFVVKNSHLLV
jgi:hypothetical protein